MHRIFITARGQLRAWSGVVLVLAACGDDGRDRSDAAPDPGAAQDRAHRTGDVRSAADRSTPGNGETRGSQTKGRRTRDCDPSPPDPDPSPRVDSVTTDVGSLQVRQGETVELRIAGARLTGTTAIAAGPLQAELLDVADSLVRARLEVPHGFARQTLALEVTTPAGTAVFAPGIATTPYVVAAAAPAGGRGTDDAPYDLCDSAVAAIMQGDTIELGAGTYNCPTQFVLPGDNRIVGAGVGQTILDGAGGFLVNDVIGDSDVTTTTIAGLTLRPRAGVSAAVRLDTFGGGLDVDGLAIEGGAATGIAIFDDRDAAPRRKAVIRGYEYRATGIAARFEITSTVTRSAFAGCQTGVQVNNGSVTLEDVEVRDCTVGVRNALVDPLLGGQQITTLVNSRLLGTATGVSIGNGRVRLDGVTIRESPALPCVTGVRVALGRLDVFGDSHIACTDVGMLGADNGAGEGGIHVTVEDTEIAGGTTGIFMQASRDLSTLSVRRARLHGSTSAAVLLTDNDLITSDLGSASDPGQNALTTDTGVAFVDRRDDAGLASPTQLVGSTLNGHVYPHQQITGPAAQGQDYLLVHDTQIEL